MIYPNPATDQLVIDINCKSSQNIVQVLNLLGEEVINKSINAGDNGKCHEQLDISSLPAGLYVVNVITETGLQQAKRFVKE